MGKSRIIEKLQFKLRAKGRHGTHSPFVYSFVEEVLRNKAIYLGCPSEMQQREWNLLHATLAYIKPIKIFVEDSESPGLRHALINSSFLKTSQFVLTAGEVSADDDIFVVASALDEISFWLDFSVEGKGRLSIYILTPHGSPFSEVHNSAANFPDFKMVLDFWDALLLVQSNDFKEKQFFELK